jgi:EAL domain-containing protein (putative c-di-GMP-specific phosphodiesterase class I)/GGDEF domain-containing protein
MPDQLDETARRPPPMMRANLVAAVTWIAAAFATTLLFFPTAAGELFIVWPADALAFGVVLAWGRRVVPGFVLAALGWNLWVFHTTLAAALIGAAAFMLTLLFVWHLHRAICSRVTTTLTRRIIHEPLMAGSTATIYTLVGAYQYPQAGDPAILAMLWLSVALAVLLLTTLLQDALSHTHRRIWRGLLRPRASGNAVAWSVATVATLSTLAFFARPDSILAWGLRDGAILLLIWAAYSMPALRARIAIALYGLAFSMVNTHFYLVTDRLSSLLGHQMLLFFSILMAVISVEVLRSYRESNRVLREKGSRDALTGLFNDVGFEERLDALLTKAVEPAVIGIQLVDLDEIETLVGHRRVGEIEYRIAGDIVAQLPAADAVARVRPGLFLVAMAPPLELDAVVDRLWANLRRLALQYMFDNAPLRIALAGFQRVGGDDLSQLISSVMLACQKAEARFDQSSFTAATAEVVLEEHHRDLTLLRQMRSALGEVPGEGRFTLYCQRIVDTANPQDIAVEILLRWIDGDARVVPPGRFMPVAEQYGLMPQIDDWVFREAVRQLQAHPGLARMRKIAINLSGASLADPQLPTRIAGVLEARAFAPGQLCFEVTETMVIHDKLTARDNLAALKAMGCRLSLDDFGTGLATFDYLKRFPYDFVKIDGSFIRDIADSALDRVIVKSMHRIAAEIDATTIAEFVENESQATLLNDLGIRHLQGYGIHRPCALGSFLDELDGR